jgi:hypothetical protein
MQRLYKRYRVGKSTLRIKQEQKMREWKENNVQKALDEMPANIRQQVNVISTLNDSELIGTRHRNHTHAITNT